MAEHQVRTVVTFEVTSELEVREHAFKILRQRMEPGPVADALVEKLADNFGQALEFLVHWQIIEGAGALRDVPGLSIKQVTIVPE